MEGDLQTVIDIASRESSQAASVGVYQARLHIARHLRWDHGMSRRKVARRLGVRERWVKKEVDEREEEDG